MLRYTVDFDKTTYAHRIDEVKVRYQGFKALGLLPWGFIYVIRPLIVGLIPHDTLMEIKLEDNGVDLRKYRRRHRRRRKDMVGIVILNYNQLGGYGCVCRQYT